MRTLGSHTKLQAVNQLMYDNCNVPLGIRSGHW